MWGGASASMRRVQDVIQRSQKNRPLAMHSLRFCCATVVLGINVSYILQYCWVSVFILIVPVRRIRNIQGHPEFRVNPYMSEYSLGGFQWVLSGRQRTEVIRGMSTYQIDMNATKVQTGARKNVFQTFRFFEICNDQVTPVDDGRRNIMLARRPVTNLTFGKWALLWTRFPMNQL